MAAYREMEAVEVRFSCDACNAVHVTYERKFEHDKAVDYTWLLPDDWAYYPSSARYGEEPQLTLCPKHSDLWPVARIIDRMITQRLEAKADTFTETEA